MDELPAPICRAVTSCVCCFGCGRAGTRVGRGPGCGPGTGFPRHGGRMTSSDRTSASRVPCSGKRATSGCCVNTRRATIRPHSGNTHSGICAGLRQSQAGRLDAARLQQAPRSCPERTIVCAPVPICVRPRTAPVRHATHRQVSRDGRGSVRSQRAPTDRGDPSCRANGMRGHRNSRRHCA